MHEVTFQDEEVRGRPGTTWRCTCGAGGRWGVRDGSAEAEASIHTYVYNGLKYEESLTKQSYLRETTHPPPVQDSRERCHDCSCHINPPCGACINCPHWNEPDCDKDCQECEEEHE